MTDFQIDRRWQNLASHFSSLDEFLSWQSRQIQSKKVQQGEALQSRPAVSLNNDRSNAFFQNGHDDGLPPTLPSSPFWPWYPRPDERRSLVRSWVRHSDFLGDWEDYSSSPWSWKQRFIEAVADLVGLEDTEYALKRTNFERCNKKISTAQLVHFNNGDKEVKIYRCGNKYCLDCVDRKRKKEAMQIRRIAQALVRFGVINKAWRIVVTFPDRIAAKACSDRELQKVLFEVVRKALNKIFTGKVKSRIGIAPWAHLVGDTDMFRDRFHLHLFVLPCYLDGDKWVNCDVGEKLNVSELRNLINKMLAKKGVLQGDEQVINPQVRWVSDEKILAGKINLNYDSRGFGKSFIQSVKYYNKDKNIMLIGKSKKVNVGREKEIQFGCKAVTIEQFAKRWIWLRNNTPRLQYWGWLNSWEKLVEQGLICLEQEQEQEDREIVGVEKVRLEKCIERQFDKNEQTVKFVMKEYVVLENGQRLEVGKDIKEFRGSIPPKCVS